MLAQRIGPMHTAATYVNLCSLLLHVPPAAGTRIGVFSFGSGAASSMYHLRVRGAVCADAQLLSRLEAREQLSSSAFLAMWARYISTYGRFGWSPQVRGEPPPPSYRLKAVSALGRRDYEFLPFSIIHLDEYDAGVSMANESTGRTPQPPVTSEGGATLLQLLSSLGMPADEVANDGPSATADVSGVLSSIVYELVGSGVSADAPLMEAGLDSLGATEFQSRLSHQLGSEVKLSDTLIFDFPTLRQIEAHVTTLLPTAPASSIASVGGIPAGLLQLLTSQGTGALPAARPLGASTSALRCTDAQLYRVSCWALSCLRTRR